MDEANISTNWIIVKYYFTHDELKRGKGGIIFTFLLSK